MPEQEVLADPPVVGEVELRMLFLEVVVDVDDVGDRPGQGQRLLEAGARVQQHNRATNLAQQVVAPRVRVYQVPDHGAFIGLGQQVLPELVNPPV